MRYTKGSICDALDPTATTFELIIALNHPNVLMQMSSLLTLTVCPVVLYPTRITIKAARRAG